MFRRFRLWRRAFYRGPADLGITPPRRNGYQSPTVTAALWFYALVVRHVSSAGRIVLLCTGVILPYSLVSLLMPIHLLAFAIVLLFSLDFVIGLITRPRVRAVRAFPERVTANTMFRIEYDIENRSRLPVWDGIVDSLPFPKALRFRDGRAFLKCLAPGERVRSDVYVRAGGRGRHTLPALRVDSAFPFHLWRWGTTCGKPQNLIVRPEFHPISQVQLVRGTRYQPGGIVFSSAVAESMEFLGCRDYREGDNPRHIHWRSWARVGAPVVREFREEYLCRTALVIDTFRSRRGLFGLGNWWQPEDPVFEAALSLAAAVADHLGHQDHVVDLMAAGPEIYRFQFGRSLAYLDDILDILACLKTHPAEPFDELAPVLKEEMPRISGAVFILVVWNEARKRLLNDIASAGIGVRPVLVTRDGQRPPGLPEVVLTVSAADIRAGRCRSL